MAEFDTVDTDADGFITLAEACYARNHKLLALPKSFVSYYDMKKTYCPNTSLDHFYAALEIMQMID